MTTNQERAAEVICQAFETNAPGFPAGSIPADLAQALAEAQPPILMPDLPTDDTVGMSSGEWSAGFEYIPEGAVLNVPVDAHAYAEATGIIGISVPKHMTTDQAEALALTILAAVYSDRAITKEKS